MEVIREQVPDAHFYLFSDDVTYVKEKYQGDEFTVVVYVLPRESVIVSLNDKV